MLLVEDLTYADDVFSAKLKNIKIPQTEDMAPMMMN
jgi:hypothetical protein